MLPDYFPVFNIYIYDIFESSDTVVPPFNIACCSNSYKQLPTIEIIEDATFGQFLTIGRRNSNLDRMSDLRSDKSTLLAVYDGHCDYQVADYLQSHLLESLSQHPYLECNPSLALLEVFETTEQYVIKRFERGSTALVVLVTANQLIVGNLGDSKLFGLTNSGYITELTRVHNLSNESELKSVIERGGVVLKSGNEYRIKGKLNLSRCFGDAGLKECMSAVPDIHFYERKLYKRIVLATDGFYKANKLEERLGVGSVKYLEKMNTVYEDNACAIYFML